MEFTQEQDKPGKNNKTDKQISVLSRIIYLKVKSAIGKKQSKAG